MNRELLSFSLLLVIMGAIGYFDKHPIDVKAVKRNLSTIIDTLAKETPLDLFSYCAAIVFCGWVVSLVMGG